MANSLWHEERAGRGRKVAHLLKGDWLFDGEEVFPELGGMKQRVRIGETEEFGRMLEIDGMSQLAEVIDWTYTGALIYPAAFSALSRQNWLIAGGGDGAAPREALRFVDTESVTLVDLSQTVIAKTQELIPSFWSGCQNDPRLKILSRDVFAFMRETDTKFDIIVSDLTDPENPEYTPFEESTVDHLYTKEGMEFFRKCLAPNGIFVMQAQELSLLRWQGHKRLLDMLKVIYPSVYSYRVSVELFGYWESFIIASPNPKWAPFFEWSTFAPGESMLWRAVNTLGLDTIEDATQMFRYLSSFFQLPPELIRKLGGKSR
ncbi:MAG: hypothetical protein Q7S66_05240 [bacterium]|nr:hypothetical protein [bacterium]